MSDEVKLLPCPFCGGVAEIEETGGSQSASFATHYRVNCKVYAHANMAWTTDRNEAIAAWNTRAIEATRPTDEVVERVAAEIKRVFYEAVDRGDMRGPQAFEFVARAAIAAQTPSQELSHD